MSLAFKLSTLACLAMVFVVKIEADCEYGQMQCMNNNQAFESCLITKDNPFGSYDQIDRLCEGCHVSNNGTQVQCNAFCVGSGNGNGDCVWFPGFRRIDKKSGSFFGQGHYTKVPQTASSPGNSWKWIGQTDDMGAPFATVEMPPLQGGMTITVAPCFKVDVRAISEDGQDEFHGSADGEQYVYESETPPMNPAEHFHYTFTSEDWLKLRLFRFIVTTTC